MYFLKKFEAKRKLKKLINLLGFFFTGVTFIAAASCAKRKVELVDTAFEAAGEIMNITEIKDWVLINGYKIRFNPVRSLLANSPLFRKLVNILFNWVNPVLITPIRKKKKSI